MQRDPGRLVVAADAMLADEGLRLALLTSQMVTDLLPALRSLTQRSAHALMAGISATFPGDHVPDEADPNGINRWVPVRCLYSVAAMVFQAYILSSS